MAPVYKFSNAGFLGRTYKSVLAENDVFAPLPPSDYDFLEADILGTTQTTVDFLNLTSAYSANYKHLQIRYAARSTRGDTDSVYSLRFNNSSGTYYMHNLNGRSGNFLEAGSVTNSYIYGYGGIAGSTLTSGTYSAGVIDILDAFSSNKNSVIKSVHGIAHSSYPRIVLMGGLWVDTAAINSITFTDLFGSFTTGTRFSLYGLKA